MAKSLQSTNRKDHSFFSSFEYFGSKMIGTFLLMISYIGFAQDIYAQKEFVPIFNGKDLEGWHISKTNHHGTIGNFYVEDGAIVSGTLDMKAGEQGAKTVVKHKFSQELKD